MTEDNHDQVTNSSRSKKLPISIFLLVSVIFPFLNLRYNPPTIPILGFHGIFNAKSVNTKSNRRQSQELGMDYKEQEI